ncbi:MAG: chromophore lyase CpcT/CpeT [Pseudomonadota bacterium]
MNLRSGPGRWVGSAFGFLLWAASAAAENSLESDLATMLAWFPGEYDNHPQVYNEARQGLAPERWHRHTHHIFQPVDVSFVAGPTLYAQQSQHYDRADIYRQRIYAFSIDDAEDAIRLTIYTPRSPETLLDLHLKPALAASLTADDFVLKPGCEVFWKRRGDSFHGFLKTNACSYFSSRYDKQIFLNETLELRQNALLLDDTAVDAEGNVVFGAGDRGPSINTKLP